jgi:hypothetical protein
MTRAAKIKIYTGLSLRPSEVTCVLPTAIVAPPIKRGQLHQDLQAGFHVIGIIDGEFQQNLAVSPSEILDLLRCGVSVYGSSSMGAMRAVELAHCGMRGVGKIYDHIAATPYFKDDHLGQLYFEGRGATLPLIDFEFALAALANAKTITKAQQQRLRSMYRRTHFTLRSVAHLQATYRGTDAAAVRQVLSSLAQRTTTQKRQDARLLVTTIARDLRAVANQPTHKI